MCGLRYVPLRGCGRQIRGVLLGFIFLLVSDPAVGQGLSLDDPVPLQRKAIPLSRLPAELERVRQGVLVQMPRNEFEALVQRAARAGDVAQRTARLIKAKYSAELVDSSLAQGSGQWTIHDPGSARPCCPFLPLTWR